MLTLREGVDTAAVNGAERNRLQVSGFYGDGAVFQHGKVFAVKGRCAPQQKVSLTLGSLNLTVFANDNGEFLFKVPPQKPAENLEMLIAAGDEKCLFRNIDIGNVYLAGGQSNMEFPMGSAVPSVEALDGCDLSHIRCFALPVKTFLGGTSEIDGVWQNASPEMLKNFSAVAGFFAVLLRQKIRIPVGIVTAAYGGVNIEAFISEYSLLNSSIYRQEAAEYAASAAQIPPDSTVLPDVGKLLDSFLAGLFPEIPADGGTYPELYAANTDDSDWETMLLPDSWTQSGHNHAGVFVFRKEVELPAGSEKKSFRVALGAVDKADKCFVNGTLIGATGDCRKFDHWNTPRVYETAPGIFREGKNVITIQAASMVSICADGGLIGPAEIMQLESGSVKIPLSGSWKMKEVFDAGVTGMTCMRRFGQGGVNTFHILYDNMISPISGSAFAAVLWYQGEANAICTGHIYEELLSLMIADWRRNFLDPELPFYIIQLPEFQTPRFFAPFATWPLIREAQLLAAEKNSCATVVTLGCGSVTDIHPVNKLSPAQIIAEMESARLQGNAVKTLNLISICRKDDKLFLKFNGTLDRAAAPDGFAVAGKDMIAYPAECHFLSPDEIALCAAAVPEPFAVWYAWAENPRIHTLKSVDGKAVTPFRAALDGSKPTGRNLIP